MRKFSTVLALLLALSLNIPISSQTPISCANITGMSAGDTTDGTSWTTGSGTLTASRVIIGTVTIHDGNGGANTPTLTETTISVDWTQIGTLQWDGTNKSTTSWWGLTGAGGTGTITVNVVDSSGGAVWNFVECSGMDTTTPIADGSWATATGTSTTPSVTEGGMSDSFNRPFAVVATVTNTAITEDTGWTELGDNGFATSATRQQTAYKTATDDLTYNVTITSGAWFAGIFELNDVLDSGGGGGGKPIGGQLLRGIGDLQ